MANSLKSMLSLLTTLGLIQLVGASITPKEKHSLVAERNLFLTKIEKISMFTTTWRMVDSHSEWIGLDFLKVNRALISRYQSSLQRKLAMES